MTWNVQFVLKFHFSYWDVLFVLFILIFNVTDPEGLEKFALPPIPGLTPFLGGNGASLSHPLSHLVYGTPVPVLVLPCGLNRHSNRAQENSCIKTVCINCARRAPEKFIIEIFNLLIYWSETSNWRVYSKKDEVNGFVSFSAVFSGGVFRACIL